MDIDQATDTRPEAQTGATADDTVQLTINIGFNYRPVFVDPDDSSDEPAMKEGPPFLRFPVQLGSKDSRIVKQLLSQQIAFIALEVQQSDGQPGYYRTVTVRN